MPKSKAKGSAYEREIAQRLEDWVYETYPEFNDVEFIRVPNSGGWKERPDIAGDVCMGNDIYKLLVTIECKRLRQFPKFSNVFSGWADLNSWWCQTRKESIPDTKPLLFMREDRCPTLVVMLKDWVSRESGYQYLEEGIFLFTDDWGDKVVVMGIDTLFSLVHPTSIVELK